VKAFMALIAHSNKLPHELFSHMMVGQVVHLCWRALKAPFAELASATKYKRALRQPFVGLQVLLVLIRQFSLKCGFNCLVGFASFLVPRVFSLGIKVRDWLASALLKRDGRFDGTRRLAACRALPYVGYAAALDHAAPQLALKMLAFESLGDLGIQGLSLGVGKRHLCDA
jgi:hypothetical protein